MILAEALKRLIEHSNGAEMVAEPTADPEAAIQLAAEHAPDVVLMDVDLGAAIDGIEATHRVKEVSPTTKVIILTGSKDRGLMLRAVEAGACGFLSKGKTSDDVLSAVQAAAKGEVLIDPSELSDILREVAKERASARDADLLISQITPREKEILQFLAGGHSNSDIAGNLFISPQTVQTHVRNILVKLGVNSKLQAVTFAVRHGIAQV
jgi:DNA-binding NarL/FixJ family response regulator